MLSLIVSPSFTKSKKTILYAPTFYPSSLEKLGLSLGDITSGYNLIIKPHMWTYYLDSFGGISLKGQRNLIFKLIDQFDHIRLLEPAEYNVTPLSFGFGQASVRTMRTHGLLSRADGPTEHTRGTG